LLCDEPSLVEGQESAAQEFPDLHATSLVGALGRSRRDLDPSSWNGGGVVAGHDTLVAAGEDVIEVSRRGSPHGGLAWGVAKALVEVLDEGGEAIVRFGHGGYALKP
jgi:hypothetical protein